MKFTKDTYLVVLTKDEAKALALFLGPHSTNSAVKSLKVLKAPFAEFKTLVTNTDMMVNVYQQVKEAKE